jgi:hypothetical protein
MKRQLSTKIKALAIYQIIGGLVGIGLTFYLLGGQPVSLLLLLIFLFIFGLYTYSIYCGIILFKDARKGLKRSKLNQLLQVISFGGFGYAYQFLSGIYLLIGADFTESFTFNFNFGISSSWKVSINSNDPTLLLNVNIVAIFLVVFIDKAQQKLKSLDPEQQFSFEGGSSSVELLNVQVSDTT